jgi:hypothetical protein
LLLRLMHKILELTHYQLMLCQRNILPQLVVINA